MLTGRGAGVTLESLALARHRNRKDLTVFIPHFVTLISWLACNGGLM